MNEAEPVSPVQTLITGQSEMATSIRAFDWSKSSLGPIDSWSAALLATVNLMLHSPFPTILAWGTEMVFLYNDAAISILTTKHPNALGALYRDVFHEAWDLISEDLDACLYRGKTAVRDNKLIPLLLDGVLEDRYFSYSMIPVYENGKIQGIYDAFRNVTETVLGARRLRESERRLRVVTKVAKLGVFVWDTTQDVFLLDNDYIYEIFGRTREQGSLNGAAFLGEVVHPDDRDAFRKAVTETLQEGKPCSFKGRINLPDGNSRWIEFEGELQPEIHGSTGKIFGTVRDITETRKNEEILRENAKYVGELAAIVANSDDVIVSKDLDGIIKSWNDSAARIFGYTADEIIGSSILKIIPEHLHSEETVILKNIRAGRRIEHFETVRRAKDGRLIDVSLTVSPIKDENGRVIGASKILRDISARKRIERSLLQAEKIAATGRMAATIAHEINNPLEAVMNLLYLLRPMVSNPIGAQYLESAEIELGRVSHIAKQTLGYYREHAAASSASLAEIVAHAITIYEPRCGVIGIEIQKSIDCSTKIVLRRGEMMQVISNIIANSMYAMSQGGILSISLSDAEDPADGIVLTIRDNGIGIPEEALPHVFEAFFTTRSTVGTGIGLFVAKQFVEGHGGRIKIKSDTSPQSHGTTLEITLPLRTAYDVSSD